MLWYSFAGLFLVFFGASFRALPLKQAGHDVASLSRNIDPVVRAGKPHFETLPSGKVVPLIWQDDMLTMKDPSGTPPMLYETKFAAPPCDPVHNGTHLACPTTGTVSGTAAAAPAVIVPPVAQCANQVWNGTYFVCAEASKPVSGSSVTGTVAVPIAAPTPAVGAAVPVVAAPTPDCVPAWNGTHVACTPTTTTATTTTTTQTAPNTVATAPVSGASVSGASVGQPTPYQASTNTGATAPVSAPAGETTGTQPTTTNTEPATQPIAEPTSDCVPVYNGTHFACPQTTTSKPATNTPATGSVTGASVTKPTTQTAATTGGAVTGESVTKPTTTTYNPATAPATGGTAAQPATNTAAAPCLERMWNGTHFVCSAPLTFTKPASTTTNTQTTTTQTNAQTATQPIAEPTPDCVPVYNGTHFACPQTTTTKSAAATNTGTNVPATGGSKPAAAANTGATVPVTGGSKPATGGYTPVTGASAPVTGASVTKPVAQPIAEPTPDCVPVYNGTHFACPPQNPAAAAPVTGASVTKPTGGSTSTGATKPVTGASATKPTGGSAAVEIVVPATKPAQKPSPTPCHYTFNGVTWECKKPAPAPASAKPACTPVYNGTHWTCPEKKEHDHVPAGSKPGMNLGTEGSKPATGGAHAPSGATTTGAGSKPTGLTKPGAVTGASAPSGATTSGGEAKPTGLTKPGAVTGASAPTGGTTTGAYVKVPETPSKPTGQTKPTTGKLADTIQGVLANAGAPSKPTKPGSTSTGPAKDGAYPSKGQGQLMPGIPFPLPPGMDPSKEIEKLLACFPSHATVSLEDGSVVRMDALNVGDRVLTSAGTYSTVFAFTHRDPALRTPFVRLETANGASLELSAGHYLSVNGAVVEAENARVGDMLVLADGSMSAIRGKSVVYRAGLFNPQTLDGNIVVNDVQATTFTVAVKPTAARALLAPLAALFRIFAVNVLGESMASSSGCVLQFISRVFMQ